MSKPLIDKVVHYFNPSKGLERTRARYIDSVISKRGYDAAGSGRRNNWPFARRSSANTEISAAGDTLRVRHREMVRNNPYASKAVAVITSNVIGTGIKPAIVARTRSLSRRAKSAWGAWSETTKCDYDGRKNFASIQRLVMRSVVESGEVFVRRVYRRQGEMPIALQVLEADFLDVTKDGPLGGGSYMRQGIEFSEDGRRLAYWFYASHPGDSTYTLRFNSVRVPAEDVAHIFYEERPGQIRGVPFGASTMLRLKEFREYEDAQLVRQKVAACFAAFVSDTAEPFPGANSSTSVDLERVEPGMVEYLRPGQQVSFASPPGADGYDEYSKRLLQGVAAGYGITYEALTGDLSNVNFSSGRMGWIEMGRLISDYQELMLVPQFLDVVWRWFVEAGVLMGVMSDDVAVTWTPPARMMIDPVKETNGLSAQVRNGFISWQEAVRQMGYDPDLNISELKEDYTNFDAGGFELDCDGRKSE